ncbi:unnamed protein product [Lampetra planeri]
MACVRTGPIPKSVAEVRSFVGFASYYRRYVMGSTRCGPPLQKSPEMVAAVDSVTASDAQAPADRILGLNHSERGRLQDRDDQRPRTSLLGHRLSPGRQTRREHVARH